MSAMREPVGMSVAFLDFLRVRTAGTSIANRVPALPVMQAPSDSSKKSAQNLILWTGCL